MKYKCSVVVLVIILACLSLSCSRNHVLDKKDAWDRMPNEGYVTLYLKNKQVHLGSVVVIRDQKICFTALDLHEILKNSAVVTLSKRNGDEATGTIFKIEQSTLMFGNNEEAMESILLQDIMQVIFPDGNPYYIKNTISKSDVESIAFNSRSVASHIIPHLFHIGDVLIVHTKKDSLQGRIKDLQPQSISLSFNDNLESVDYNKIEKISIIKSVNSLSLKKVIKILLPFVLLIGVIWLSPFRNLSY
ncbi:hypothetical protein KAR48_19970 [bacterium]|nr:hypothetical protein [bacterium]